MIATCGLISNLVLNAGNKFKDLEHMQFIKDKYFKDKDVGIEYNEKDALVAIQGPNAHKILQNYVDVDLSKYGFKSFVNAKINRLNCDAIFYRTGYTGEDGFEVSLPENKTEQFVEMLFSETSIAPAGLGARDVLRLEAGELIRSLSTRSRNIRKHITYRGSFTVDYKETKQIYKFLRA